MEFLPPMPLREWRSTKETLHRFCQIVGKVRLAASARRNHWWNVPFHITGRGLTTRPMECDGGRQIFTIDFDFVAHQLRVDTLDGTGVQFPLYGQSVASFYRHTVDALASLGLGVRIHDPRPFKLPDRDRPFSEDTEHDAYDVHWATRYWQVLSQVNLLLEDFARGYSGKTSPVHVFWHSFDIAVTRYSERRVHHSRDVDPVTREAYSREVISFGFWFGDDDAPEPAFYSYTAPEPDGLATEPLRPPAAEWVQQGDGHLARLLYAEARASSDRRGAILDFFASAYTAGARRARWDMEAVASAGGITDPVEIRAPAD